MAGADFTPCRLFTGLHDRFHRIRETTDEFQQLNSELLGLSIDSYYSHIAWVRNIKEKFGIEITFPISGAEVVVI